MTTLGYVDDTGAGIEIDADTDIEQRCNEIYNRLQIFMNSAGLKTNGSKPLFTYLTKENR